MKRLKNSLDFPQVGFYRPGRELVGMTVGYAAIVIPGLGFPPLTMAAAMEVAAGVVERRGSSLPLAVGTALFLVDAAAGVTVLELKPYRAELTVIVSSDFGNLVSKDCLIVTAAE